ncbi:MAG TPA: VCBS repeat-containing protein, partial [Acidimicrobiia bacterium]|nr:VCBS repeat-containing protein [Acidimicrobiia bacterium]
MSLRRALVVVVSASFLAVVPAVGPAVAGAAEEHDFNGDGYADLVIADWRATVGGQADAGGVHVLYGSPDGPRTTGVQLWTQDSAGVPNVAEPSDAFGYTWVAADFDGDGYDDLAL